MQLGFKGLYQYFLMFLTCIIFFNTQFIFGLDEGEKNDNTLRCQGLFESSQSITSKDKVKTTRNTKDNKNKKKIAYNLFSSSVVQLLGSTQIYFSEEDLFQLLKYMSEEDPGRVEEIFQRVKDLSKNSPKLYKAVMSYFSSLIPIAHRHPEGILKLGKRLGIGEDKIGDLKEIVNFLDTTKKGKYLLAAGCSGVVVSHNSVITAAHCLHNWQGIYYKRGDDEFISAKIFSYPISSLGSRQKHLYDVGAVVFPDYTFSHIVPLKIASSLKELDYGRLGVIGIDTEGTKRWGDVDIVRRDDMIFVDQHKSEFVASSGTSGSPMINNRGEVFGLVEGAGSVDDKDTYDLYVNLLLEQNYSFLEDLVRNKGVLINGIN